MKVRYLIVLFVFLCSFTFPVKVLRITSFFGESRKDHFHNGIDLASYNENVYAVMPGEILFYYDNIDYPEENPLGYGNFVILQHGDRYRSFYYHLQDGSIPKNLVYVAENQIIGKTGSTGHSSGGHLHFTMVDVINNKIVNPLLFLTDFKDSLSPVINSVWFSTNNKTKERLTFLEKITGKNIKLFIETWDRVQTTKLKLGIYKIEVFVDNRIVKSFIFDSLDVVKSKGVFLNFKLSFEDIYSDSYIYNLGDFFITPDSKELRIEVKDLHGNCTMYKIVTSHSINK